MAKNLFKWMMALAIVATPMVFTACGDDDEKTSTTTPDDENVVAYRLSTLMVTTRIKDADLQQFLATAASVEKEFTKAVAAGLGQNYDGSANFFYGYPEDSVKVHQACDAVYQQLKSTDFYGGSYSISVLMTDKSDILLNKTTVAHYRFGKETNPQSPLSGNDTITFENQQLNAQNFWVGDSVGKYTYKEKMATVTGTFSVWDGGVTSWSGFAISGRTETGFSMNTLTPDQYNNVVGGGHNSKNFLVVYDAFNDYECIEFEKPVHVTGLRYTNSAYALTSMENGENSVEKFTREDWFACNVICLGENNDTIKVKQLELAYKNTAPSVKFAKNWTLASIQADGVKKIKFSFDGSQKPNGYLIIPSYICIDNILYKSEE